jgi:hypothetical protein
VGFEMFLLHLRSTSQFQVAGYSPEAKLDLPPRYKMDVNMKLDSQLQLSYVYYKFKFINEFYYETTSYFPN